MLRNWKLATVLAIAISAGGTWGSVQAGGNGGNSGRSGGSSHSGGSYSSRGGSYNGGSIGGFKPSGGQSGGFKPSGGSNNGNSGVKTMPKNTGVVGPFVPKVGNSNGGNSGGIKLPGLGTVGGSKSGSGNSGNGNSNSGNSGVVKKGNNNSNPILKSPALGGLGINLGNKFPGNGSGQGNGNGPGNGNGNGPGNGNGNGNHHNHHHHGWPPIVISLPHCQPNYCPPPCPPIYYPQPYPVAVPIVDPVPIVVAEPAPAVVVNNNVIVDGKPVDPTSTDKPAEQQTSTEAAATTAAKPADPNATDLVSKDVPLPKIPVGATLTLQGKDLADKQGQVVLQLGDIALPATINEWKNDSVTCTLPLLGLTKASKATLHVVKADGKTASTMNCELVTTLPTSVEAVPASATDIDSAKYEQ